MAEATKDIPPVETRLMETHLSDERREKIYPKPLAWWINEEADTTKPEKTGFNPATDLLPALTSKFITSERLERTPGHVETTKGYGDLKGLKSAVPPGIWSRIDPYDTTDVDKTIDTLPLNFTKATIDARHGQNRNVKLSNVTFKDELFADIYSQMPKDERLAFVNLLVAKQFFKDVCKGLFSSGRPVRPGERLISESDITEMLQKHLSKAFKTTYTGNMLQLLFIMFCNYFTETRNLTELETVWRIDREPTLWISEQKVRDTAIKMKLTEAINAESWELRKSVDRDTSRYTCNAFADDLRLFAQQMGILIQRISAIDEQLASAFLMFKLYIHELDRGALPDDVKDHSLYRMLLEDMSLFHMVMKWSKSLQALGFTHHSAHERLAVLDFTKEVLSHPRFKAIAVEELISTVGIQHFVTRTTGALEGVSVWANYNPKREHQVFQEFVVDAPLPGTNAPTPKISRLEEKPAMTSVLQSLDGTPLDWDPHTPMYDYVTDLLETYRSTHPNRFFFLNFCPEPLLIDLLAAAHAKEVWTHWTPLLQHDVVTPTPGGGKVSHSVASKSSAHLANVSEKIATAVAARAEDFTVWYEMPVKARDSAEIKINLDQLIRTTDPRVALFHSVIDRMPTAALIQPPTTLYKLQSQAMYHLPGGKLPMTKPMQALTAHITGIKVTTIDKNGKMSSVKEVEIKNNIKDLLFKIDFESQILEQEASNHQMQHLWRCTALTTCKEFFEFIVNPEEDPSFKPSDSQIQLAHDQHRKTVSALVRSMMEMATAPQTVLLMKSFLTEWLKTGELTGNYMRMIPRSRTVLELRAAVAMYMLIALRDMPGQWIKALFDYSWDDGLMIDLLRTDLGRIDSIPPA